MTKPILLLLALAVIGGGVYYYFTHGNGAEDDAAAGGGMPVVTYTVTPEKLVENLQAVGSLEASESAVLSSEIAGKIATIYFAEGQPVTKGELLLEIDNRTFIQEVERSRAAYDLASTSFGRKLELHRARAASTQVKDEAEAQLRATAAAHEEARINLEKTKIFAPFDGIVGLRKVSVGDYMNTGDSITDIVAVDPIKVQFTVPEKYFSVLKDGMVLYASVDAWPGKRFEGILYAIDPVIDPDTRNIKVKALLPNRKMELRPGMFAYIHLHVGTKENALMIPEEALIPSGSGLAVMTVVEGVAKITPVTVGIRQQAKVEVLTGLAPGDVVITAGHAKVREDMPVQAIPAPVKPAPAASTAPEEPQAEEMEEEEVEIISPATTEAPSPDRDRDAATGAETGAGTGTPTDTTPAGE